MQYADLLPRWAAGQYVPMRTRQYHAAHSLTMLPPASPAAAAADAVPLNFFDQDAADD